MDSRALSRLLVRSAAVAVLVTALATDAAAEILRLRLVDKTFEAAIALLGKGQLKEADALFEKLLAQSPGQPSAILGRAQIAVSEDRLAEAEAAVNEVLERWPNLPEAHNMKGVVLLVGKRIVQARGEFSKAVELRPAYVTPRMYLAALTREEGNHARTAAEYKALTSVAPRLPAGYIGEAEALLMMGKADDAFATLDRWKRADSSSVLPSHVIANVLLARGRHQDAIQELKSAVQKAPGDSATLKLLGDAYAAAGTTDAAVRQYEAALAADPRNAEAAVRLGDMRLRSGDTARAMHHFRTALEADANHPVACNNLAWLIAEGRGNLDEALQLAQRAAKNTVGYVDAHDTVGWVHYLRGEYDKAVNALQKARALDPRRADVAAHLGMAYAKAGRKQRALDELKHALAVGGPALPNRAELQKLIADLSAKS